MWKLTPISGDLQEHHLPHDVLQSGGCQLWKDDPYKLLAHSSVIEAHIRSGTERLSSRSHDDMHMHTNKYFFNGAACFHFCPNYHLTFKLTAANAWYHGSLTKR